MTKNMKGCAFIGRFSVVDNNLTAIWIRSIAHIGGLQGFDLAIEPNGDISIGLFTYGIMELDNDSLGDTGRNLGILHYDQNGQMSGQFVDSAHSVENFGGMCYSDDGFFHIAGTFVALLSYGEHKTVLTRWCGHFRGSI